MDTIAFTGTLTKTHCWCGIHYAIPTDLYAHVKRQHNDGERQTDIYCPLGHIWVFAGKGAGQIERERREMLEWQLANRDEDLRSERAAHAATKGQLTKTRKRVAGGVCPCCNRSFVNLRRHMTGQHPDYAAS